MGGIKSSARQAWIINFKHLKDARQAVGDSPTLTASMLNIKSGWDDAKRAAANKKRHRGCQEMHMQLTSFIHSFFPPLHSEK